MPDDEDKAKWLSPYDFLRLLRAVFGSGSDISADNPLEVHDPKVGSLISYEGTTTDDGAGDGSTLIDSVLATKPDYNGNLVIITSGDYAGQARDINGATNNVTGTVTPASVFGGPIVEGTTFVIVGIRTVPVEVAAIEAKLDHADHGLAALKTLIDATEAKLDKLAGETPVPGTTNDKWKTGTGTSGETGADLVTIGANDTSYKLHSLLVNISALTPASTVTVKLFMQVKGTERKVYSQAFTQGTDPDGLWIVNGTVGIHEALRVEVESDTDDDKDIDYDYMLEAM